MPTKVLKTSKAGDAIVSWRRFKPRPPFWGADAQTCRGSGFIKPADLSSYCEQEGVVELTDGSGDRIGYRFHEVPEAPATIVILHGLAGCLDSVGVRSAARLFLSEGFSVVRVSLRGAPPYRHLAKQEYNAGRSRDLVDLFNHLRDLGLQTVFAYGISLGGSTTLRYLGQEGEAAQVDAAATIGAPIDLWAAVNQIARPRNLLYNRKLLEWQKQGWLSQPDRPDALVKAIQSAKTLREFDDQVVARANGFESGAAYYDWATAFPLVAKIKTPTLAIHTNNDPWIPLPSYLEAEWSSHCNLEVFLGGGHCGLHSRYHPERLSDLTAVNFFRSQVGLAPAVELNI